ncbi:MAG: hypothetical protein ABL878_04675 [Burkholderiales bacterium]
MYFVRYALLPAVLATFVSGASNALACGEVLRGEIVIAEREVGLTQAGESATFPFLGAGWFQAAEVVKTGGFGDNTIVTLELDGEQAISASFADLKKPWMQVNSQFLIVNVRAEGNISTLTVWYMNELKFRNMAVLRIDVAETGVESLKIRTVMNKPAPHEHLIGQASTAPALPAFK